MWEGGLEESRAHRREAVGLRLFGLLRQSVSLLSVSREGRSPPAPPPNPKPYVLSTLYYLGRYTIGTVRYGALN